MIIALGLLTLGAIVAPILTALAGTAATATRTKHGTTVIVPLHGVDRHEAGSARISDSGVSMHTGPLAPGIDGLWIDR